MSNIDLSLLRVLKTRENYDKIARYIPKNAMSKKTMAIVNDFGKYFANNEEESIDFESFRSLFFTSYHKNLKEDDIEFYNKLIKRIAERDEPEAVVKNMVNNLLAIKCATKAAHIIDQFHDDEEIDLVRELKTVVDATEESMQRSTEFECADFDDSSIGEGLDENSGYDWPLPSLNKHYRKIQPGDCTIVAARPGKGKTTFLCQMNVHLSKQMPDNKVILWMNNESRRQKIMSRQIQAALGLTDDVLHKMMKGGTLRDAYTKVMGRPDRVKVYDIHGKDFRYIEDIIESVGNENIGAVVFDMLDKVKMPMPANVREDQRLEELYSWGRELGVTGGFPTFPSSQVSLDGAGLMFPMQQMLKDSKTGKQGACDNILMIGSSDDPMLQHNRGISMPKEKCKRAGEDHLMIDTILFNQDIGRYIEEEHNGAL